VPPDERKQVEPDPVKPGKHDTGRSIILRIMRGGTPLLEPDQHPVDSLMLRFVGHRTEAGVYDRTVGTLQRLATALGVQ
jgi:hypothetical protein